MESIENIVVAVDFSTHSRNALREAMRLARWSGATIHAVSVVHGPGGDGGWKGPNGGNTRKLSEEEAGARLDEFIAVANANTVTMKKVVRAGEQFHEILEVVSQTSAELLIIGSSGAGHAATCVGHLAESCVRRLPGRVLVVRRDHTRPFAKVSAFIDFSKMSDSVLEHGIIVARAEEAALKICHIHLPPWRILHYRAPTPEPPAEEKEEYNRAVLDRLEAFVAPHLADMEGLEVGYNLVECSQNVIGIEDYVEESGADLVIVGTRGRTGLRRLLPCTRAEHIIRSSPCSVLAIKPEKFH